MSATVLTDAVLQLEELLSETPEAARRREAARYDRVAGDGPGQIVLFGAGKLGRRTVSGLRAAGIEVLAVADNNPTRWGDRIDGVEVLSPAIAAARYGGHAVFVVTIWTAGSTHRLAQTVQQLEQLGCQKVTPWAWLAWRHAEYLLPHYAIDLPSKVLEQADAIRATFDLLSDEFSRTEYVDQIRWRLTGDPGGLRSPVSGPQYLVDDVAQPIDAESFLDCGAYDGDTLRDWLGWRGPSFARYTGLEPDAVNRRRFEECAQALDAQVSARIVALPYAVGPSNQTVVFDGQGTASSSVGIQTATSVEVECRRIDDLARELEPAPTFIKLDIEGAEPGALDGGASFIRETAPLLAVCVYHRQDHLWSLPLQLVALRPDYSLYLRPHNEEGWDLVCYAVPPGRVLP